MHHVFQLDVAHLESSRTALDRAARFLHKAPFAGVDAMSANSVRTLRPRQGKPSKRIASCAAAALV
jgi:hypothetical protein